MKKSAFIFASAVVAAMMCVFTGCSDEDNEDYVEFTDVPNDEVMVALETATTPIAFRSTGRTLLLKSIKGDKWVYELPSNFSRDMMFTLYYMPEVVFFKDGKVYCNLWSFTKNSWAGDISVGTSFQLLSVWEQYNRDTHDQQIYVEADFNSKENLLKFSDETFAIFTCEYDEMTLSDLGENNRSLAYYELTSLPEDEDCHIFNNCMDGFQFIIDCAREKYGDTMIFRYEIDDWVAEREYDLNIIELALKNGW